MAIKIIQAENESTTNEEMISFFLGVGGCINIMNETTDPIESIFIKVSIEDWEEISAFIKQRIKEYRSNG